MGFTQKIGRVEGRRIKVARGEPRNAQMPQPNGKVLGRRPRVVRQENEGRAAGAQDVSTNSLAPGMSWFSR